MNEQHVHDACDVIHVQKGKVGKLESCEAVCFDKSLMTNFHKTHNRSTQRCDSQYLQLAGGSLMMESNSFCNLADKHKGREGNHFRSFKDNTFE